MPIKMTIRVRNRLGRPSSLVLEPWGEVALLTAGEVVEIHGQGPAPGEAKDGGLLQVDMTDDGIIVWGWSGSDFEISRSSGS
ncbi:hypothetical protein HUA76_05180 [Myxococcus sp. CA056]|uniref:hypothetical protein n=1 Tax=Myxococcus sp. CA056 TaxID=2741740 RepID=UPI00157ABF85|nr:hypothetical protein [Myxococcus sp. CA056]NTX10168.1 hypothetical protein [Myxococcus sp. CA056]